MYTPTLTVVAGCNGSGKSTYSKTYFDTIQPFDYDKRYLATYRALPDSEFRDKFAKNQTTKEFISSIEGAFLDRLDFCYETNFDNYPTEYVKEAKKLGYEVCLIFYCLNSLELAEKRVDIRTKNKGHFISNEIIEYKWKEGYKNLNLYFGLFDYVLLVDNSKHLETPTNLFSLTKNGAEEFDVEIYVKEIPNYAKRRYPKLYDLLLNSNPNNLS